MSKNKKQYNKLQWFFLIIFIPTLFAILMFSVILSFLGFDVLDEAKELGKKTPIVAPYFEEEELEPEEQIIPDELQGTIAEKEARILELEQQLELRAEELTSLTTKINELDTLLEQERQQTLEMQQEAAELAETYMSMSTKNAAAILSELENQEVLLHIAKVGTEARAAILAKMEPERAAQIMSLLAEGETE